MKLQRVKSMTRVVAVGAMMGVALLGLGLGVSAVRAQSATAGYPGKPIRFVVPFGPGTSTDQGARFIGQRLGALLNQTVIIDNKPGANGFIAMQYVLGQPADGYTLAYGTNTTHAANISMFKSVPYDPVKDFTGVGGVTIGGGAIVVRPDFPARSIAELVTLARQNPGKYTFGSSSAFARIGIESLKHAAGIDLLNVPYKGSVPNVVEVMAGNVDITFDPLITMLPLIRSGKVRALGVSTLRRVPGLDDVPTVAEQGFPGYQVVAWQALFAPAATPPGIVNLLSGHVASIVRSREAIDFFRQNAMWDTLPMSSGELEIFLKAEIERWRIALKQAGIEAQ